MAEKCEFKNKPKKSQIAEAQKITPAKITTFTVSTQFLFFCEIYVQNIEFYIKVNAPWNDFISK